MGLFDSVYAECPECGTTNEFQSKADEDPYLNKYTIETAPTHILTDVLNSPVRCCKCGTWFALVDRDFPPHREPPRPAPSPTKLKPPRALQEHGEFGQRGYIAWWDSPFSFDDIDETAPAGELRKGEKK